MPWASKASYIARDESMAAEELLRLSSEALISMDASGMILSWNPAAASLYDWGNIEGDPTQYSLLNGHGLPFEAKLALKEGSPYDWCDQYSFTSKSGVRKTVLRKGRVFPPDPKLPHRVLLAEREAAPTHREAERLRLMANAAASLLKHQHPDAMVGELFETIHRERPVDAYLNFMVSESGDHLVLDSSMGWPAHAIRQIQRIEFGQTLSGMAAQQCSAVIVNNVQRCLDCRAMICREQGFRAYACFPLMAGERLIGTLSFASYTVDAFDSDDLALFEAVAGFVATAKERVRVERERDEWLQRLIMVAESNPSFIWMSSPDGTPIYVSSRWSQYTGLDTAHASLPYLKAIIHADDIPGLEEQWEQSQLAEGDFAAEFRMRDARTGEYRWFLSRGVTHRDSTGKVLMRLGSTTDIHDRKTEEARLHQLIEERTDDLQATNASLRTNIEQLETFNSMVSHDIRGPLRSIISTAQILKEDLPTAGEANLALIDRQIASARRLATLVEALLDLSRLSYQPIHRVVVDFSEIAEEVAEEMLHRDWGAPPQFELQGGIQVDGDPSLLRILLSNLIENACKYSPLGAKVEIGTFEEEIFIRDNGIGFDQGEAEKIFRAFQRLDNAPNVGGHGIGLATVDRIIRRHGGSIRVESCPGAGATFYFRLG